MSRSAEKLELYKMLIQLLSLEEITIMLTGLLKFLSFGRCINNNQKIHTQACLCPFFFFKWGRWPGWKQALTLDLYGFKYDFLPPRKSCAILGKSFSRAGAHFLHLWNGHTYTYSYSCASPRFGGGPGGSTQRGSHSAFVDALRAAQGPQDCRPRTFLPPRPARLHHSRPAPYWSLPRPPPHPSPRPHFARPGSPAAPPERMAPAAERWAPALWRSCNWLMATFFALAAVVQVSSRAAGGGRGAADAGRGASGLRRAPGCELRPWAWRAVWTGKPAGLREQATRWRRGIGV